MHYFDGVCFWSRHRLRLKPNVIFMLLCRRVTCALLFLSESRLFLCSVVIWYSTCGWRRSLVSGPWGGKTAKGKERTPETFPKARGTLFRLGAIVAQHGCSARARGRPLVDLHGHSSRLPLLRRSRTTATDKMRWRFALLGSSERRVSTPSLF